MGIFGFLKPKNNQRGIALDIGTEFVKSSIFQVNDENQIEIVGYGKARQKLTDISGGVVTDIAGVIENCEESLYEAADQAGFLPDQCVVGIAGELVKGNITTVHYTRTQPRKKLAYEELKSIVEKVQNRAFQKARESLAKETGYKEIDIKLVHSAIVNVKIDSYKVNNPIGFQGKDVAVSVFNTFAPIVHIGAIQAIAEGLELDLLSISAEPYAVAKAVGLEGQSDFSAIFLDIGGGTTDVAVVRNGGLEGTKMIAIGGRAFTKKIANDLAIDFDTAEKMKISYASGNLDEKTSNMIKNSLETDCEVWLTGVQLTLEEFSNVDLLPSKIMLCGGASQLPEIKKQLETDEWYKDLAFAKKPKIEFIQIEEVNGVVDKTEKLKSPQDITPMALANVAVDFVGKETMMDEVLGKVMKSFKD